MNMDYKHSYKLATEYCL